MVGTYPNVNTYAWRRPGGTRSPASARGPRRLAHELVEAAVAQNPFPSSSTSAPCDGPGASPSRRTRNGIGLLLGSEHQMRVARVGSGKQCSRRCGQHGVFLPILQWPARAQWLRRRRSGSRRWRRSKSGASKDRVRRTAHCVRNPGTSRAFAMRASRPLLRCRPLDGNGHALDAEQPLDDALGLLIVSLAEVVVTDDAIAVYEVERWPVMVFESSPDGVVVIDRDRVVDPSLLRRLADTVNVMLEGEFRRVDADHDQPVSLGRSATRRGRGVPAQPVDAGQRPEVHEDDVAAQLGGAEWLGVEPPGRPAKRRHVQWAGHGRLAKAPKCRA